MAITRDRIKIVGGRCLDVAMGVFLIAVLVLIWNSSRTRADSATAAGAKTTKKARIKRSPNIEALTAIQGTECVVTCPSNITTVSLTAPCIVVNYPAPTVGTFCTGPAVCTPASGFCFPVGTTTVTCTAPGTVPGQCSFTVTVRNFDVCLQDDSNPNIVFQGNSQTGAYTFCCGATTFTGIAQVSRRGNVVAFAHYAPDRRVQAIDDGSVFKGTAAVQSPPGTIRCTIGDRDTRNNTCMCAAAVN
jgi:hypothetical protein